MADAPQGATRTLLLVEVLRRHEARGETRKLLVDVLSSALMVLLELICEAMNNL